MTSSVKSKKKVVIVGGSFAGRRARRILKKKFEVILIDEKGYFEFVPSTLRCFVEPKHSRKIVLKQPSDVIVGKVKYIRNQKVELEDGNEFEFDYCLICAGSKYSFPIKSKINKNNSLNKRVVELENHHTKLTDSKKCVIVGGGTVGVELAAEIVGKWPNMKEIILITSKDRLLERLPQKASDYAKEWLIKNNAKLIFNTRVIEWDIDSENNSSNQVIKTDNNEIIEADIIYKCVGYSPESDLINITSNNEAIHVNAYLQVLNYHNIFAAGDCTDTREEKTAFNAELAATVAAKNVIKLDKGLDLMKYPEAIIHGLDELPSIVCVSLYKNDGIFIIQDKCITGYITGYIKYMIESIQILMAKEWSIINYMMEKSEEMTLWFIKFMFGNKSSRCN